MIAIRKPRVSLATAPPSASAPKPSNGGSIRIELQDEHWNPLEGYRLEQSTPIHGNHLDAPVTWGPTTKIPTTRPIVHRFQLDRAPSTASRSSPDPSPLSFRAQRSEAEQSRPHPRLLSLLTSLRSLLAIPW